jgi:Tfp pilus assembly protein PilO
MEIHIGEIIRKAVSESPLTNKQITDKLNRSENTLYDIYRRQTTDAATLLKLSVILGHNFLQYYLEDEELKTLIKTEVDKYKDEIKELKTTLAIKEEQIQNLQNLNAIQKEVIQAYKETNKKK